MKSRCVMRDTEYKSSDKSNKVLAIRGDLLQIFQQVMPPLFRNFLSAYVQLLRRGLHHRTRIRRLLVATEAYFGLDRVFGSYHSIQSLSFSRSIRTRFLDIG